MTVSPKPLVQTPEANDLIVASGSAGGEMISVVGINAGAATTIHTVPVTVRDYQRIRVLAVNIDTVERTLVLLWGGTATKDHIYVKIGPQRGLVLVIPDMKLYRGKTLKAFCTTTAIFNVYAGVADRNKEP